jgi:hypothetical protein
MEIDVVAQACRFAGRFEMQGGVQRRVRRPVACQARILLRTKDIRYILDRSAREASGIAGGGSARPGISLQGPTLAYRARVAERVDAATYVRVVHIPGWRAMKAKPPPLRDARGERP